MIETLSFGARNDKEFSNCHLVHEHTQECGLVHEGGRLRHVDDIEGYETHQAAFNDAEKRLKESLLNMESEREAIGENEEKGLLLESITAALNYVIAAIDSKVAGFLKSKAYNQAHAEAVALNEEYDNLKNRAETALEDLKKFEQKLK